MTMLTGAVVAGLPYGCASSTLDAFSCRYPDKDLTPRSGARKSLRQRRFPAYGPP
ncbi:hypothetical protein VSH64_14605 [Amycolatopsis rhabdoformis]|uniref:Uncharacterized protein n=1 Tax=Amycolatopsis rhabdoformis TaxID=1448059 RepID=A0ABZ1IFV3_9PSEU|nr:hypothetical protein [Amycolatopsis rhabdoformis]WSE33331.1 hypothetical protein VSH64_14605 [Amycolatopsis rhabdoformis]